MPTARDQFGLRPRSQPQTILPFYSYQPYIPDPRPAPPRPQLADPIMEYAPCEWPEGVGGAESNGRRGKRKSGGGGADA